MNLYGWTLYGWTLDVLYGVDLIFIVPRNFFYSGESTVESNFEAIDVHILVKKFCFVTIFELSCTTKSPKRKYCEVSSKYCNRLRECQCSDSQFLDQFDAGFATV